jgi:hypothetical protein
MSKLRFYDRLTDQETSSLNGKEPGRITLITDQAVEINGVMSSHGHFLLPASDDKAWINLGADQGLIIENLPFNHFPEKSERDNLIAIGKRLQSLEESRATWHDWLKVPPIAVNNMDKLKVMPFEQILQKYIWHLQRICEQPRTHLTVEEERTPVWRARRIPLKAYEHLSIHTEDWEYKKARSVVPRKVLSTIPNEFLDFYENRLASRLLWEIHKHLSARLINIRKYKEIKIELELGTHWRKERVYSLLGEVADPETIQKSISSIERILMPLYDKTLGMFDKPLFTSISPQSRDRIPPAVQSTNVLNNDRHYRFVNQMWREFLRDLYSRPKTNLQVQLELQALCQDFDRYCLLLVCRALDQLGYKPDRSQDSLRLERGRCVRLVGNSSIVEIEWSDKGHFIIRDGEDVLLRMVPLIMDLSSIPDNAQLNSRLDQIIKPWTKIKTDQTKRAKSTKKLPSQLARTLIMYPGTSEERRKLPLHLQRLLNTSGIDLSVPIDVGFLPISTYELGTVERVARCLRWAISGTHILSYPPRVSIPVKYQEQLLKNEHWIITDKLLGVAKVLINPEEREYRQYIDQLRTLRGTLTRLGNQTQQDVERLDRYAEQLSTAFEQLEHLRVCPLCQKVARVEDFHVSDGDIFTCECRESSCQVTWGTRMCSHCHQPYPFLDFQKVEQVFDDWSPDWVDHQFGMDALAAPCPGSPHSFICPSCGACGNRQVGDMIMCQECNKIRDGSLMDINL